MPGIYIHVPFCRQACRYCDFFFTVSLKYREDYCQALLIELGNRKGELGGHMVNTVYLGGGTPSVLSVDQLRDLFTEVFKSYEIAEDAEITVEANPDDLTEERLQALRECGVNRLSIGIQSFKEEDLKLMRRSHSVEQAMRCIELSHEAGFRNITMDLIYGIPGQNLRNWEKNVLLAMKLPIQHLSAYHLSYEPGTVFSHWKKKGRIKEIPEELSIEQYHLLRKITSEHGFEHYEISNFAKEGYRSRHNSSYWDGSNYLGFGPSAHSYNGRERRWNISSLQKYTEGSKTGGRIFEHEVLSRRDRFHDYLITSLRTSDGLGKNSIRDSFGEDFLLNLEKKLKPLSDQGEMIMDGDRIRMSPGGWLKSDHLIRELMLDEESDQISED